MPVKPTIDPIDRSNSPAMRSSVTVVPTMPTWAAMLR